jgi:tetratricopeptide (TPR) repeat protein
MSSRASSERVRACARATPRSPAGDAGASGRAAAQFSMALVLGALALAQLGACSSTPQRAKTPAPTPASSSSTTHPPAASGKSSATGASAAAGAATSSAKTSTDPTGGAAGTAAAPAAVHPEVTPAARADFDRAVQYMRSGNATEAELGFKQVALQYPQYSAPLVNLALLQRKEGHLDQAEATLKHAVERENGSAVAWTELGATQRMRGEFRDAASSYEHAIAADPRYAPAWRNLGVVSDLYLGDPNRALKAFEQYKELTGEDKPVSGWIAELRQRLGLAQPKRPAGEAAPGGGSPAPAAPGEAQPSKGAPGDATPPAGPSKPQPSASPANAATEAAVSHTGG